MDACCSAYAGYAARRAHNGETVRGNKPLAIKARHWATANRRTMVQCNIRLLRQGDSDCEVSLASDFAIARHRFIACNVPVTEVHSCPQSKRTSSGKHSRFKSSASLKFPTPKQPIPTTWAKPTTFQR